MHHLRNDMMGLTPAEHEECTRKFQERMFAEIPGAPVEIFIDSSICSPTKGIGHYTRATPTDNWDEE